MWQPSWNFCQFKILFRCIIINPYKPKGISHYYQLDQSISVLRGFGRYFLFLLYFYRTICKQIVETLVRRRVLRRLIWACTVWLCTTKRTLGFYGLKWNSREQMCEYELKNTPFVEWFSFGSAHWRAFRIDQYHGSTILTAICLNSSFQ